MQRARIPEFLRFCIAGGLAFMVDAGLLELLVHGGIRASVARIFSIGVALNCAYLLHGGFTYQGHRGYNLKSWVSFVASNLMGVLINYMIFISVIHFAPLDDAQLCRLIGLVAGTGVALFFNYWANRRFAFARKEP